MLRKFKINNTFESNIGADIKLYKINLNIASNIVLNHILGLNGFLSQSVGRLFVNNCSFIGLKSIYEDTALIRFQGLYPFEIIDTYFNKGNMSLESLLIENSNLERFECSLIIGDGIQNYLKIINCSFEESSSSSKIFALALLEDYLIITDCVFNNITFGYLFKHKYSRINIFSRS